MPQQLPQLPRSRHMRIRWLHCQVSTPQQRAPGQRSLLLHTSLARTPRLHISRAHTLLLHNPRLHNGCASHDGTFFGGSTPQNLPRVLGPFIWAYGLDPCGPMALGLFGPEPSDHLGLGP